MVLTAALWGLLELIGAIAHKPVNHWVAVGTSALVVTLGWWVILTVDWDDVFR